MREQSSYVDDLEPDELSEWELQDDDPDRTRILWGRVTVLVLALGLAFFLGRTTGSVGASPTRIDELEADLAQANQNIAELEARLAEPETTAPEEESPLPDTGGQNAGGQGTGGPNTGGQGENAGRSRTYIVKAGDTLRDLAVRFYGDVDLARLIADANGIEDTSQLLIGEELEIPPEEP
jgi:nucleoid-associated protein YgaU